MLLLTVAFSFLGSSLLVRSLNALAKARPFDGSPFQVLLFLARVSGLLAGGVWVPWRACPLFCGVVVASGNPGPHVAALSYCFTCKTGFVPIYEDGWFCLSHSA